MPQMPSACKLEQKHYVERRKVLLGEWREQLHALARKITLLNPSTSKFMNALVWHGACPFMAMSRFYCSLGGVGVLAR